MIETNDEFGQKNNDNDRGMALEKRNFVMDELLQTERNYVRDLALVVDDYIEMMRDPTTANCDIPVPEDLTSHDKIDIIFSNIEQIYEWHKNVFLNEVERCIAKPLEISYIFKKNESKFFKMYIVYCQKNQLFDCFMNKHRLYFEELRKFSCHMYPLRDFLIRPVKRIMTYTLLLRNMLEYSKRAGDEDEVEEIQQAVDVMERLINNIDQMMVVDRLRDFNGDIGAQGKLLFHGLLRCVENPGTGNKLRKNAYNELYVFLFEQSVMFTAKKNKKKKYATPLYVYKTHISTNKMTVEDMLNDSLSNDPTNNSFTIRSVESEPTSSCFVCQVDSAALKFKWLKNLQDIIQVKHNIHPDTATCII